MPTLTGTPTTRQAGALGERAEDGDGGEHADDDLEINHAAHRAISAARVILGGSSPFRDVGTRAAQVRRSIRATRSSNRDAGR
jgi:hypothetical protein